MHACRMHACRARRMHARRMHARHVCVCHVRAVCVRCGWYGWCVLTCQNRQPALPYLPIDFAH